MLTIPFFPSVSQGRVFIVKHGQDGEPVKKCSKSGFGEVWTACNNKICITCNRRISVNLTYSAWTDRWLVAGNISVSCKTKNVVYQIKCNKCHLVYVGETSQEIKKRFLQHKRDVKLNKKRTFLVNHFNLPHHSHENMTIGVLDTLPDDNKSILRDKESFWINTLNSGYPFGLNDCIKGIGMISSFEATDHLFNPYFKCRLSVKRKEKGKKLIVANCVTRHW